jgi:hypothetical protein
MGQNERRKKLEAELGRENRGEIIFEKIKKGQRRRRRQQRPIDTHTHPQEISVVWDMITKRNDTTTHGRKKKGFPLYTFCSSPFSTRQTTATISHFSPNPPFHPGEYNQ